MVSMREARNDRSDLWVAVSGKSCLRSKGLAEGDTLVATKTGLAENAMLSGTRMSGLSRGISNFRIGVVVYEGGSAKLSIGATIGSRLLSSCFVNFSNQSKPAMMMKIEANLQRGSDVRYNRVNGTFSSGQPQALSRSLDNQRCLLELNHDINTND